MDVCAGITIALISLIMIVATIRRWEWWWNHYKVLRVRRSGDTTATIFYIVGGVLFIIVGILIAIGKL